MRLAWLVLVGCGGSAVHAPSLPHGTQKVAGIAIDIRGSGPVCIVHPGGPGLESTYLHLAAFEKRFTTVYIDPAGTGGSDKLPEYSLERDAAAIEAVRKHLGLERVCLIGHSYGGFVVQQYAVEHPRNVSGLLLYSTTPTTDPEWEKTVAASLDEFKGQAWFAAATKALAAEDTASSQAELDALLPAMLPLYFADWTGHHEAYEPLAHQLHFAFDVNKQRPTGKAARFDVRRKLGLLGPVPTVIIAGKHDFLCGPTPSQWLASAISGSKLVMIEQAGHFAHLEQPGEFDAAVGAFAEMLH